MQSERGRTPEEGESVKNRGDGNRMYNTEMGEREMHQRS